VEQEAPNAHVPAATTLHVTFNVPADQNVLAGPAKTAGVSKGTAAPALSGAKGGAG